MDLYTLTRRELLCLWGTASTVSLFGGTVSKSQNLVPAKTAVDHLLLGVADLDHGITWVGYQIFGPRDGSRARPDGRVLKWKSLGVLNKYGRQGIEPIPFFIQWAADSLHPSEDSPGGCSLQSFELEHPAPAEVIDVLRKLGIEAKVRQAKDAKLKATLMTPKGKVELS